MTDAPDSKGPSGKDAELDQRSPIVGLDIANSGGGIGMDVQSNGISGMPSVAAESVVKAQSGRTVIGTRIVQAGSGIGLRVVQNGPGTGFRSSVTVDGPSSDPSK